MIAFTLCSVIVYLPWFRFILKLESKNHFIFMTLNSIYCGAKYWPMIRIPSVFHFITLYHLIIFLGSSSNGFSFFDTLLVAQLWSFILTNSYFLKSFIILFFTQIFLVPWLYHEISPGSWSAVYCPVICFPEHLSPGGFCPSFDCSLIWAFVLLLTWAFITLLVWIHCVWNSMVFFLFYFLLKYIFM